MTPLAALIELLARLEVVRGAPIFVSDHELNQWPAEAVAALKSQGLLAKSSPASHVICPGCERDCAMPVDTALRASEGKAQTFVVCDKRSDINRVPISVDRLSRWQCDAEAVRSFIAKSLSIRESGSYTPTESRWEIGIAKGSKRSQMLCLSLADGLKLVAGDRALSLLDLANYRDGVYLLDAEMVRQLVDSNATTDKRYTPSQARREASKLDTQVMYESWQKQYRRLIKENPKKTDTWCAKQIEKMDIGRGKSFDYIRKNMKS